MIVCLVWERLAYLDEAADDTNLVCHLGPANDDTKWPTGSTARQSISQMQAAWKQAMGAQQAATESMIVDVTSKLRQALVPGKLHCSPKQQPRPPQLSQNTLATPYAPSIQTTPTPCPGPGSSSAPHLAGAAKTLVRYCSSCLSSSPG